MENASKALIMAGGVLISLLIIGLLLLMFTRLSDYQKTGDNSKRTSQIAKFNMEYEGYLDDKGIKGADILSLINKIIDYNAKTGDNQPEINNPVDYTKKMAITITNLSTGARSFNEKYAYEGSNRMFTRNEYSFGVINGINNNNRREISNLLNSFKNSAVAAGNIGEENLKKLSSIYDPNAGDDENIEKIKEALRRLIGDEYITWNGSSNPSLKTISEYRQYSEFKSSIFIPDREADYYDNGQIQHLYFRFDR